MLQRFRLQIPRGVYEEMLAQAVAELPNECCGLLAGKIVGGGQKAVGSVETRYPLANLAASAVEYLSDPRSMFDAVRNMRDRGLDILAVYHSHPTTDPVPSKTDLERNYSDEVLNLIISLKDAQRLTRGWWLSENSMREAEWDVV